MTGWKERHAANKLLLDVISHSDLWVPKREALNALIPTCPECKTDQVEILGWPTCPANYKCRSCKHKFQIHFRPPSPKKVPGN